MPKKKITKKTSATTTPDVAEPVSVAKPVSEPLDNAALATMLSEFKATLEEASKLRVENEKLRDQLVQSPDEGGKRIVDGEAAFDVPRPKEPPPKGTFAVFRSPSPGFRQKLVRSRKIRFENGDTEIVPPQFAEFEKGVCLIKDKEQIELMRGIEAENLLAGIPVFVEIEDEEQVKAALSGKLASRSIQSQTVTAETSLEELVV